MWRYWLSFTLLQVTLTFLYKFTFATVACSCCLEWCIKHWQDKSCYQNIKGNRDIRLTRVHSKMETMHFYWGTQRLTFWISKDIEYIHSFTVWQCFGPWQFQYYGGPIRLNGAEKCHFPIAVSATVTLFCQTLLKGMQWQCANKPTVWLVPWKHTWCLCRVYNTS